MVCVSKIERSEFCKKIWESGFRMIDLPRGEGKKIVGLDLCSGGWLWVNESGLRLVDYWPDLPRGKIA